MTQSKQPILEFFFDYGSPFSYLADTQVPRVAERSGAAIVYRPMLLGAVLKATGNASPMAVPAKGRYMMRDLERWTKRYGVPFHPNPFSFLSNTPPNHARCSGEPEARSFQELSWRRVRSGLGRSAGSR